MNNGILTSIRTRYPTFTKAVKKVADFILSDPAAVLYMSIIDLATECNVGDTTVFRFCKDLNLRGYQDFKIALAQSVSGGDDVLNIMAGDINPDDTVDEVAQKVLSTNLSALNQTYAMTDVRDISKTVDWMAAAKKIIFFGVGTSLMTAMDAASLFIRITPKVSVVSDSHLQAMTAALMGPEDMAVIISYSGSTKDTCDVAKIAKEKGAKIVSITRFAKSPLAAKSDLALICGAEEGPLQGGALSSKIAQLYVLNLLYFEFFRRTQDVSCHNKELTANAVSDKLF